EKATIVDLVGKVKFRRGVVEFRGDQRGATDYLIANGGRSYKVIGGTATAGNRGTATAGNRGTATAGDYGTATAGDRGTATAGVSGTAKAGRNGVLAIAWWDNKADRRRVTIGYVG